MLYQKMLIGNKPYFVALNKMSGFARHRHSEFELSYCVKGAYDIHIDRKPYRLNEGELAFISSMVSHEIPEDQNADCLALTIEVGPTMLNNYFDLLSGECFSPPVIRLEDDGELKGLLTETVMLLEENAPFSELIIKGNIYKICAYILKNFINQNEVSNTSKTLKVISNIEKSLEIIYNHFDERLNIEDISSFCGYSKSNFCKIFKEITGDTFHNVLNKHRITVACHLLKETNHAVENIAIQVGFADSKSFCRVFKQIMGITPGAYRKDA
ncbi:MAG: AraC family transcriptional regulator [Clostridia bacterium]|nr:AraC family transcriptional regulator [Clostridia bacterium]